MDETTNLSEEQLRLLHAIGAEGRLSIENGSDERASTLRMLEDGGYVRALSLNRTGDCCIFVLTGQGVIAVQHGAPSSHGGWEDPGSRA